MQKSKKATLVIITIIFIYTMLATFNFVININYNYLYIINPLFWIILAVALRIILGKQLENNKIKKKILEYTLVASLTYIIIYMISGLFLTFGKNPYLTTVKGLLTNLWILGSVIIAKEYIRYRLINNVYEKDKVKIAIILSVVYVIFDLQLSQYISANLTPIIIIKTIADTLLPLIATNILYSYIAINCNYLPSVLYEFVTKLYMWISPILPNAPWIMTSILNTVIPIILFLYIRFVKNKNDYYKNRENIMKSDPRNIIPLIALIILAIWFAIGIFPIKPVAIASGSMEKTINVGDIAIIKKCNANDLIAGDIVQYKMEGFTVVHRVIEKKQKNGKFYFITKGDNNPTADSKEVKEEQIIGKLIFVVRYLGYPAVWLHIVETQK